MSLHGQEERSEGFLGLGFNYGVDLPTADMADRFGQSFHAGLSVEYYSLKWKGLIRLETGILFGDEVREDVLSAYRLGNGALLGNDGAYADVFLRQRGSYAGLVINKLIIPRNSNSLAGLAGSFGVGYLQHHIRFQVDSNNAPQYEAPYSKGLDRNTGGLALKQGLSYLHIGKNRAVNYEVGIFVTESFSSNRRGFNFDTGLPDTASRLDILIGLDFKWILAIRDRQEAGEIYY